MKYFIVFLFVIASSAAFAQTPKRRHKKHKVHRRHQVVRHYVGHTADHTPKPSLGTNFYFNAVTVHGHYESPDESIVTVEDDKKLGDLLDYRTNYKNRLAEETGGLR